MTISSRLAGVSAFFLGATLFYSPLAYGCTRPETLPALFGLLFVAIAAGLLSFLTAKRRPAIPGLVLICVAVVLIQGWWLTWDPVFAALVSASGEVVDTTLDNIRSISFHSMAVTSLLLGAFLVLCEIIADANLRRFLLMAMAISGVFISVIGIILKLSGEQLMHYFWRPADIDWNNFAFYRYHGNAGAFLNLVWPVILVYTRRAYRASGTFTGKLTWTLSAMACGLALFLNSSKASLVIGMLILPWPFLTWLMQLRAKALFSMGAATLLLIGAGLYISSQYTREAAFQRLTEVSAVSFSLDARLAAYQDYLNALPAVGWFGLGPGLFHLAFPYQTSPLGNVGIALRDYAHEDYLQTVLEWGWFGTVWWTLLVGGGLYRGIKSYNRRELFPSKTDRHMVLAAVLGVCGTLAQALMDFPLQIPSIRLFFFVLLALCWASPRLLLKPPKVVSTRKRYRLPIPADVAVTTSSREP